MEAHVICCNDSVEHVYFGDKALAEEKMEELAKREYERNYKSHIPRFTYKEYRARQYWHIHTVEATIE